MRSRVVPEFLDERVMLERGLNTGALHAATAAVNQPDFAEARGLRRMDVLGDDRPDVARRKGVQVDLRLDRNAVAHCTPRRRW